MRSLLINAPLRRVCELGAGRSIFLDIPELYERIDELVLVDESAQMLSYSNELPAAKRIVSDVRELDMPNDYFDCVIASLGDAFNGLRAWQQVASLLLPGGWAVYTGPSIEWATRFRSAEQRNKLSEAEFESQVGTVTVPSYVRSQLDQFSLWKSVNLSPLRWIEIYPADVPLPLSRKILVRDEPFCIGAAGIKNPFQQ